jgi:hypothetical protein
VIIAFSLLDIFAKGISQGSFSLNNRRRSCVQQIVFSP